MKLSLNVMENGTFKHWLLTNNKRLRLNKAKQKVVLVISSIN